MIASKFTLQMDPKPLVQAVDKGMYKSFSHAAASIRKAGQAKIVKAPKDQRSGAKTVKSKKTGKRVKVRRGTHAAAPPGHAPYTARGQYKNAITFDASKTGAVIGPRYSRLGTAGEAHEKGGRYKGSNYPQRPTMGPALSENLSRIPKSFAGSVG